MSDLGDWRNLWRYSLQTVNATFNGSVNTFYTEHGLRIHTIFVSKVPNVLYDKRNLEIYFKQFGAIESIKYDYEWTGKDFIISAFIQYRWDLSASNVLHVKHKIKRTILDVRAADSWEQPDYKRCKMSWDTDHIENKDFTIMLSKINDYCLLHLFSFLSLKEKANFTSAYPILLPIFERTFKAEERTLNLNKHEDMTFLEIREILKEHGHLIENVSYYNNALRFNRRRILAVLKSFCKNLKELNLLSVYRIPKRDFKYIYNLEMLEKLELMNCDIDDEILSVLCKLPNLRDLDLSRNRVIKGKYLNKFKKLQHLSLNKCWGVKPINFIRMCKQLKKLETLNINGCDELDTSSIKAIGNLKKLEGLTLGKMKEKMSFLEIVQLKNLKSLTTSSSDIIDDLSECKNRTLKKLSVIGGEMNAKRLLAITEIPGIVELRISSDESVTDKFLEMISNSGTLEFLDVSDCKSITNAGIISLVKKSTNLKCLDISSNSQFSDDLIYDTIDLLKFADRDKVIKLIIGDTNIGRNMALDPKYIGQKKLLLYERVFESYLQMSSVLFRTNHYKYKKWSKETYVVSDEKEQTKV